MILYIVVIAFLAIAGLLTWYFLAHSHGEKAPVSALWIAAGFGVVGAAAAAGLEYLFIPTDRLIAGPGQALGPLFVTALGVGLIEESCKFIPIAIFIYRKRYFNEHIDGIIYFALAGLGFGIPENILYAIQYGAGAGAGRLILTPIFHAATTGLVGYYLIKAKLDKQSLVKPALALVAAMLLHGVYDFGLLSDQGVYVVISLMITAGLSAGLFILFMRAGEIDRSEGLSAVGQNNFCRSCGKPNPKHNLYCVYCGNRA
jgi:RsiW-degrading membrane proteinase PrsW (M82 family)